MGSGKIWIGCISNLDKIQVGCISVLRVSDQPNGFTAPFSGFFVKIKKTRHIYYLKLFVFNEKPFEL